MELKPCPFCGKETDKFIMFRGDIVGCRYCGISKKQTNADRIRAMTDEELSEFISGVEAEAIRRTGLFITVGDIQRGKECWLEWLRGEVEDGE